MSKTIKKNYMNKLKILFYKKYEQIKDFIL